MKVQITMFTNFQNGGCTTTPATNKEVLQIPIDPKTAERIMQRIGAQTDQAPGVKLRIELSLIDAGGTISVSGALSASEAQRFLSLRATV